MRKGVGFSRRQVLAGLAVGLVVPIPALATAPRVHAYLSESGKPGETRAFVLGGLFTAEPQRLAAALAEARRQTRFFLPLRHAATDRFKAAYARAAVDVLLDDPAARYAALMAPPLPDDPDLRRAAYRAAYVALLREQAANGLVVHRPAHRTIGPDAALDDHLASQVAAVRAAAGGGGDIAQLAGFLTGSVAAAQRHTGSRVKAELVRHVMARLSASDRFSVIAA